MNPVHLKTFLAVVEEQSVTRGARRVHVSQSTASIHVRELEEAVGVPLLERLRRGVRPTAPGRVMAAYARRMLDLSQEALGQVRAEARAAVPELRVLADHAATRAGGLVATLATIQASGEVSLTVRVVSAERAIAEVRRAAGDVALVCERAIPDAALIPDEGLHVTPFGELEVVLVAAPEAAPTASAFPPFAVVAGHGHEDLVPRGVRPWLTAEDPDTLRRWAVQGDAMAFVPRSSAADDLSSGRLRVVPWPGTPAQCRLVAVWLPGRSGPALSRFVDALARHHADAIVHGDASAGRSHG